MEGLRKLIMPGSYAEGPSGVHRHIGVAKADRIIKGRKVILKVSLIKVFCTFFPLIIIYISLYCQFSSN